MSTNNAPEREERPGERKNLPGGYYLKNDEGNGWLIFNSNHEELNVGGGNTFKSDEEAYAFAAAMQPQVSESDEAVTRPSTVDRYMKQIAEFGEVFVEHKDDMYWLDTLHSYILTLEARHRQPAAVSADAMHFDPHVLAKEICALPAVKYGNGKYGNQYIRVLDTVLKALATRAAQPAAVSAAAVEMRTILNRIDTLIPDRDHLNGCSESAMRGYLHMILDQLQKVPALSPETVCGGE